MVICKDGCYAYTGATVSEAYRSYLSASDDHNSLGPDELEWFHASERIVGMTLLEAKPKPAPTKKK
jgi:hypothetical protein